MITQRTLLSLGCFVAALAFVPRFAFAATATNWIERDGLRFAGRVDAGTVATGEAVAVELVLENTGDRPLWIEKLSPTCGCTVVDWTASSLLPGQTHRPAVRLDAYDIAGHHRHTVFIVGAGELLLGTVIVTADAVRDSEVDGAFVVASEFVDAGVHRAAEALSVSVPVSNVSDRNLRVDWTWKRGAVPLASSASPLTIAPGATTDLAVQVVPTSDLWGTTVEFSDGTSSITLPVRGYWHDSKAAVGVRLGSLAVGNVTRRDENLVVDLGQLELGERTTRAVQITNHGSEAVQLQRAFTSADHDLAVSFEPTLLSPGASTSISIEYLGVRRPGSFRAIVNVLFEGAPTLRLNCRGVVRPAHAAGSSSFVEVIVLEFDRRDPTSLRVLDATGTTVASLSSFDHSAYAQVLAGASDPGGRVCSNCEAAGLRGELRVQSGDLELALYAVLGDEQLDSQHMALLPAMADPNGTVIRLLHPEHSRTQDAGAVPIVLFHDAFPLVEEAARRTRVSAVYVVAASSSETTRVLPLRDVLVLDPGRFDAGPIRLRLHVSAHQILDWELLVAERS